MSSNGPARSKRKCWAGLCGCFRAGHRPPDVPVEQSSPVQKVSDALPTTAEHPGEKGDAQSAKSPSDFDLWDKALEELKESTEDWDIIDIIDSFAKDLARDNAPASGGPSPVQGLAKDIKEKMEREVNEQQHDREQRAWKIKIGQDEYSVCGFVEKTVTILNKFIAVGDVAVNFDPVHAALPWAAVRFVLVALTAHSELKSQIIFGLAKVTSLVLQCDTYRQLYMTPDPALRPPRDVLSPLEKAIIQTYVKSLLFLGLATQRQRSKSKVVDTPFRLGDMEMHVKRLLESGDQLAGAAHDCEKHCNHLNRGRVEELLKIAKESYRAIYDQVTLVVDIHQDIFLAKLRPVEGAAFDSHANEHDARCHPKTRVDLLADIYKWANDPDGKCIYWLQGMAGTGKSTISRTVAEKFANSGALGASFLFKRGEGDRDKAARFFTTIATQLVRQRRSLAQHVRNAIEADPGIAGKAMKEQFEKLITQPLEKMASDLPNPLTMVVVVDAIDECDSENDTQTIISLLPRAKQLPSVCLKFFVTSRPEFPIRFQFNKISGTYQDLVLHRVDEDVIKHDISAFLVSRLAKIREDYNICPSGGEALPGDWPCQASVQSLVRTAVPLFIFAATACRFIEDRCSGDPEEQLNKILEYQTLGQDAQLHQTYLPVLNQLLVKRTVSGLVGRGENEKAEILGSFHDIVGVIVILADPLPTASLARLLGISKKAINNKLVLLHSVLNVPSDPGVPVKLLHLSFRDFLIHPKNRDNNPFWVDEEKTHEKLATKCLKLLSENDHLTEDICGLQMPGKPRVDIEKQAIDSCLSPEVKYACIYWVYHLKRSEAKIQDGDQAYQFLQRHFLHWLEALSLTGRISESIGLIDALQCMVDPVKGAETSGFLRDAERFALNGRSVIDIAPLQLYSSALVFAPEKSIIREIFQEHISWVTTKPIVERNWSPCHARRQKTPTHKSAPEHQTFAILFKS